MQLSIDCWVLLAIVRNFGTVIVLEGEADGIAQSKTDLEEDHLDEPSKAGVLFHQSMFTSPGYSQKNVCL